MSVNDIWQWLLGVVVALFSWLLKVTWAQEKRITKLEAQMEALPRATADEVMKALKKTD